MVGAFTRVGLGGSTFATASAKTALRRLRPSAGFWGRRKGGRPAAAREGEIRGPSGPLLHQFLPRAWADFLKDLDMP